MSLDFVWYCAECDVEIESPEDHALTYPTHTYVERMRWSGDSIIPTVPVVVQDAIETEVSQQIISNYYYSGNEELKNTTSTSWVDRSSLPLTVTSSGTYRIGWNLIWGYSSSLISIAEREILGSAHFIIVVDDESNILAEYCIDPGTKLVTQKIPLFGFKPVVLAPKQYTIKLKVRVTSRGQTVRIYQSWLEAKRISE